jgi:hypothetical protein
MSDFDHLRRDNRLPVQYPVRVTSIDPERDPRTGRPYFQESQEYCGNLSSGGAFIRTLDPPSPGRRLLVRIHVPGREAIEAVGRVAWTRTVLDPNGATDECGAGVEFVDSTGQTRSALEALLAGERRDEKEPAG